ncbi:MAG: TlpA disulfide reductase family protein [Thermotaleaceae bacterium]
MVRRMKIRVLLMLMIVLFAASMLSGCFFKKGNSVDKGEIIIENPQQNEESEEQKSALEGPLPAKEEGKEEGTGVFIGDKAYDFALLDREGNEISLSNLKGKVVFINFWTTWCKFCVHEMPYIQAIYDQYQKEDVVILAVNALAAEQGDMTTVDQFLDDNGYTFPVLYDVDGSVLIKYKVRSFPTTYIIDKEGVIADFISGAMDKDTMEKRIEQVLNP